VSGAVFFEDDPKPYYAIRLGGVELPGVAKVEGLDCEHKWDIKEARGLSGATMTWQGYVPAPFDITVKFWEREQFDAWKNSLLKKFLPGPSAKTPAPLDVVHPLTAMANVTRIIIRKGSLTFDEQSFTVKFSCTQWFPQPKKAATTTPKYAQANAFGGNAFNFTPPALPSATAATRGA
jgi:hypothetical protein